MNLYSSCATEKRVTLQKIPPWCCDAHHSCVVRLVTSRDYIVRVAFGVRRVMGAHWFVCVRWANGAHVEFGVRRENNVQRNITRACARIVIHHNATANVLDTSPTDCVRALRSIPPNTKILPSFHQIRACLPSLARSADPLRALNNSRAHLKKPRQPTVLPVSACVLIVSREKFANV